MKAAIAACKGRVCQRLDCADWLIVLDVQQANVRNRQRLEIRDWPVHGRAARIVCLAIEQLICGAVSSFDEAGLEGSNVRLIANVTGPVEAVVDAVRFGTIANGQSYWHTQADGRLQGS